MNVSRTFFRYAACLAATLVFAIAGAEAAPLPERVTFAGRAGAYSSAANGIYDASTLSKRHQQWGHVWAQQGYLASWSTVLGRAAGATHDFDDPNPSHQDVPANAEALRDAIQRAIAFFAGVLKP